MGGEEESVGSTFRPCSMGVRDKRGCDRVCVRVCVRGVLWGLKGVEEGELVM